MYGHLHIIIRDYVLNNYSEEVWAEILAQSNAPGIFVEERDHAEEKTKQLLHACVQITGKTWDHTLKNIGEHYFKYLDKSRHHHDLLATLGENIGAFIDNLDYLHGLHSDKYPNMCMPHLRCERNQAGDVTKVHYYSIREGLYCLVIGILRAAARTYFKKILGLKVETINQETLGSKEHRYEHVTLSVTLSDIVDSDEAPTLIAETRKHAEKQILKNDVERVAERLEEIRKEYGEDELPLNRAKAMQMKWKALAKVSMLRKGFLPAYPESLSLDVATFCKAFPYHVVFNKEMQVQHCGIKIQQMIPSSKSRGARLELIFDLVSPKSVKFQYGTICSLINAPFILRMRQSKVAKSWVKLTPLTLKGQMIPMTKQGLMVYLSSPNVTSLQDLQGSNIYVSDIALHDVTRNMLGARNYEGTNAHGSQGPSNMFYRGGGGMVNDRGPKHSDGNRLFVVGAARGPSATSGRSVAASPYPTGTGEDVRELKRELRRLNGELAAEKDRTRRLYHGLLPPYLANQYLEGLVPDSGVYDDVSVLFCDVVAFARIMESCSVTEVLQLLTQLHSLLQHACDVHHTHRVNSIGDAFLVVSGIPKSSGLHAERLANTALTMMLLANQVASPFDYGDRSKSIKIRIGMDVGRVVSGVISDDVPRYMVIGDAATMACKLESHGLPNKIQISQAMYQQLRRKPFRIEKRGTIPMRNEGKPTTYLLVANESLTDEELTGQQSRFMRSDSMETSFVTEGRSSKAAGHGYSAGTSGNGSPMIARNKVAPSSTNKVDDFDYGTL